MCIHNASPWPSRSSLNLHWIFLLTTYIHLEESSYAFDIEKQRPPPLCSIPFPPNHRQHLCQNHVSPFRYKMTVLRQQWLYETIHHGVHWIDFATVILNPLHPSPSPRDCASYQLNFFLSIIWQRTFPGYCAYRVWFIVQFTAHFSTWDQRQGRVLEWKWCKRMGYCYISMHRDFLVIRCNSECCWIIVSGTNIRYMKSISSCLYL